jgi:epsilon-lactone hydrolase
VSIRAALISFIMKRTIKRQFDSLDDVATFREQMADAGALSASTPSDVAVVPTEIKGVACEWVTRGDTDQNQVLVYFHGGGYVFGSPESHRDLAWRLAEKTAMRILMVDYRLAPEHPFPAAIDDATACYRGLLEDGFEAHNIAFGGDSAGGGLAAAALLNLKNFGLPQPRCAVLLSPWLDLTLSGESIQTNQDAEAVLTPKALQTMASRYLGDLDPAAPLASPLFGELSGLPPMLIHVGSTEILRNDAERFHNKIKLSGGESELTVWKKMPHVFQVFASRIPEGKTAIVELADFLKTKLA